LKTENFLLVAYCVSIIAGSLVGGVIPRLIRLTHTRLQLAMSFIGGAMLGVSLLHLLPHAYFQFDAIYPAASWLLAGFIAMFFVERVFHFHHHDVPAERLPSPPNPANCERGCDSHEHDHGSQHHHHEHGAPGRLSWQVALVGLALHSAIDGIALASSVAAESKESSGNWPAGFAVFMVILGHKPFDSFTIGTLMAVAGRGSVTRHMVNLLFPLAIPMGVVGFQLGAGTVAGHQPQFVGAALAFAAGTFICIATSDLLPELQFHSHDRFKLSAALLLGLALAAVMVALEEAAHHHHEEAARAGMKRVKEVKGHVPADGNMR
jgi:zinc and cadmium transporter